MFGSTLLTDLARGCRTQCVLERARYRHPMAGALWEARLHHILVEEGWRLIEGCPGTYVHDVCGAVLIVYVDDLLMVAGPAATEEFWQKMESQVNFRDPPSPIFQYLGAHHSLSTVCHDDPGRGRELRVHMQGYTEKAVGRFEAELGSTLPCTQTPCVPEKVWMETPDGPGEFVNSCASHVATLLFLSCVCRPDVSSAVRRLCSAVSQWRLSHDLALTRLLSCACTKTRIGAARGRPRGPPAACSWRSSRRVRGGLGRSCGPAGSKVAQRPALAKRRLSHCRLACGGQAQCMLSEFLGRDVVLECMVDNTQALAAVKRGYSKKLKFLMRTQRVSIGFLHDISQPGFDVSMHYCKTSEQKADVFTKALSAPTFFLPRSMVGVRLQTYAEDVHEDNTDECV